MAWGERSAIELNPLGFMATSLGVLGLVHALSTRGDGSLLAQLGVAFLPYAYYASLGLIAHPVLRLARGARSLRATLGVSLFVGGGPGLVAALSMLAAFALRHRLHPEHDGQPLLRDVPLQLTLVLNALLVLPSLWLIATFVSSLAGVQRIARWKAALALAFALVVTGLAVGTLHQHVELELGVPHFTLMIEHGTVGPDVWM